MIDSHCHLADEAFSNDLDAVIARARAAGLQSALCILAAGDERESEAAARVRARWPAVRFSAGVHPHQAGTFEGRPEAAASAVESSLASERGCAIGEIGLDYHYDFAPRPTQIAVFEAQIALARTRRLPIVIHTREATDDTFAALRRVGGGEVFGVFHCFTGDRAMARRALDEGFHISLSGIATFPKAEELREVARVVPDDRLLFETDAPYLAPVPFRGKRNEPSFVVQIAEALAGIRGVAPADFSAQVTRNFEALFGPTPSVGTA
jgi:TatD DNase family protein